jgi:hypothetical protein
LSAESSSLAGFPLEHGGKARKLLLGVFATSALILGRISAEGMEPSREASARGEDGSPRSGERPLRRTPARLRILAILKDAGGRLTKPQILDAMRKTDPNPSENTLRIELANMRNAGWIDNDQKSRPRGYGITDQASSILETPDR